MKWNWEKFFTAVKGFVTLEISFGYENRTVSSLVMAGEIER
jgi:hypothetical protein